MSASPTQMNARSLLLQLLLPYRLRIIGALIALIIAAACALEVGNGLRHVIDLGFGGNSPAMLDRSLMQMLGLIVVLAAATYCRFYLVSWLGERVTADLRRQVFNHLLTLPPPYFELGRTGEVISRVTNDTAQLETVIGSSASMALRNSLLLAGGLVMLLVTSFKLTLLVLLCVPLVVGPIVIVGRRVRKLSRTTQDRVAELGAQIDETIHEIRVVQAYGHEAIDRQQFAARVEATFATAQRRIGQRASLIAIVITLVFGAIAMVLWKGGHDVLTHTLTAGQLVAFAYYSSLVAMAVGSLSEVFGDVQRAVGATERLLEILTTAADIAAPAQPQTLAQPVAGAIDMREITFCYPTRPELPALQQFTLQVAPGEKVALVGASGAGKTTVFQLLLRFYDPQQGSIAFDGIPLPSMDPGHLRQHIALVPQDPVIFATSVLENVRYGRPQASRDEVQAACVAAFAHSFIEQLPEGYDSYLGERGVRLSGGQRQRIAIARALLADRPLLLLDEATSALDAESERAVQQALTRLMQGRTTLIIAHRLATVTHADRIVVLDQGRVIESGTHDSLLAHSTVYQRYAQLQLIQ